MLHESPEPNDRLRQATEALRETSLSHETLAAAEDAVLARVKSRRAPSRKGLLLVAGLATAATMTVLTFTPNESAMAQVMRIAENGDNALHHLRLYEVQPDKSLKLTFEAYTDGERNKFIDMYGAQYQYANGRVTMLRKDGSATIETQKNGDSTNSMKASARKIIEINTKGHGARVRVSHGVVWEGRRVDRYTVEQTIVDGRGQNLKSSLILIADPVTERPLEMQAQLEGMPATISKWDYPAPDPALLSLPLDSKTRIYDIDDERNSIMRAMSLPGTKAVVGGQEVELLQLWVDEGGNACAIAKASYSYPFNYGIHIDDFKISEHEETDPFSGKFGIKDPTLYRGRPIQFFFASRAANSGPVPYPNRVTLEIPVFRGKEFLGRAKFENVPVNRAWSVYFLLQPENVPFWEKPKSTGQATAAAE